MTYSHAKEQDQRTVVSKDRVDTNRRTETIALSEYLMRSVTVSLQFNYKVHVLVKLRAALTKLGLIYYVLSSAAVSVY